MLQLRPALRRHVNACVCCDKDCGPPLWPPIPYCKGDYGAALDELLVAEEALALCDPQLTAAVDNVPLLLIDLVGAWGGGRCAWVNHATHAVGVLFFKGMRAA